METKIEKLNQQFEGITYINNKITFIKNTLPNELAKISEITNHNKYNYATVDKIIKKDINRISSFCPYFNECGGCSLCHVEYKCGLLLKKENLINLFIHNKIDINDFNVIANEKNRNYRNKITLKIKNNQLGYYKNRSHDFLKIKECKIAKNSINNALINLMKLNINEGEVIIRSNYKDEIIVVINTLEKINIDINILKEIINLKGVVLNNNLIYGNDYFYEELNNLRFKVNYQSFFQINNYTNEKMLKIVNENIKKESRVLDLYCGVGTFTINASKKAKSVLGVEISASSISNALENKTINNITNVDFLLGDTTNVIRKLKNDFDTVIIDPPRSGLNNITRKFLINNNFEKIIYVSCNPETLVRDLKILKVKYNIKKLYLIDSFSYTKHIETITILNKKDKIS